MAVRKCGKSVCSFLIPKLFSAPPRLRVEIFVSMLAMRGYPRLHPENKGLSSRHPGVNLHIASIKHETPQPKRPAAAATFTGFASKLERSKEAAKSQNKIRCDQHALRFTLGTPELHPNYALTFAIDKTYKPFYKQVYWLIGMRHQISVSDETLRRLKSLAEPFVDREPEDVIRRLLDQIGKGQQIGDNIESAKRGPNTGQTSSLESRSPNSRVPRERGARVQIGNNSIDAVSVRDLYEQALRFFVEHHKLQLQSVVPFRTSRERYLVAREPIHPGGNPFVVPVNFGDFHMEAHKDYRNAIQHLRALTERMGLTLTYFG